MDADAAITVVRLGHRPGRDERTTTHVALVARAFGAERAIVPATAGHVADTVADIADRFGGDFEVCGVDSPRSYLAGVDGPIVHLTMYGLPVAEQAPAIREAVDDRLVIAVGAGKVPGEVYDRADWNVAVTNQPHSEIAALGVFLDRLSEGRALARTFDDAAYEVVPTATGKRVEPVDEG